MKSANPKDDVIMQEGNHWYSGNEDVEQRNNLKLLLSDVHHCKCLVIVHVLIMACQLRIDAHCHLCKKIDNSLSSC